ncbi:helix-turn-helix domain-containing protein [Kutzneria sp. CA-103260]|uniref:helix-turn-helix domain-containing protein n=1 Tax=Kutzneria sp. CA-103260 TaxID=2802641 RepID=UPI003FA5A0A5
MAGLHQDREVPGWRRLDRLGTGPPGTDPLAGRSNVRAERPTGPGDHSPACQHEIRLTVAPSVASWWDHHTGLDRSRRRPLPAQPDAAGPVGRRAGRWSRRLGWDEDQRCKLARVTQVIGRLFHVSYTLRGVSYLLHWMGWSPQVTAWRTTTWATIRG